MTLVWVISHLSAHFSFALLQIYFPLSFPPPLSLLFSWVFLFPSHLIFSHPFYCPFDFNFLPSYFLTLSFLPSFPLFPFPSLCFLLLYCFSFHPHLLPQIRFFYTHHVLFWSQHILIIILSSLIFPFFEKHLWKKIQIFCFPFPNLLFSHLLLFPLVSRVICFIQSNFTFSVSVRLFFGFQLCATAQQQENKLNTHALSVLFGYLLHCLSHASGLAFVVVSFELRYLVICSRLNRINWRGKYPLPNEIDTNVDMVLEISCGVWLFSSLVRVCLRLDGTSFKILLMWMMQPCSKVSLNPASPISSYWPFYLPLHPFPLFSPFLTFHIPTLVSPRCLSPSLLLSFLLLAIIVLQSFLTSSAGYPKPHALCWLIL